MAGSKPEIDEASEVHRHGGSDAPALFTCEHASERLPAPWTWLEADRRLRGTHWAVDLGAADLAIDLARAMESVAVLARFTRLLVDANRPEDDPTLVREEAEGERVHLNSALTPDETHRRLERYHRAYHRTVDREVARSRAPILIAVHTFTPVYEGRTRSVEAGVLFDREEALAVELAGHLAAQGFAVGMNEPYSGREGLIYAIDRHARARRRRALEIEIRQDLAVVREHRARVVAAVRALLTAPESPSL